MSRLPDPKKYWTEYVNKFRSRVFRSQEVSSGLLISHHEILDFHEDVPKHGRVVGVAECLWKLEVESWDSVYPIFAYMPEFSSKSLSWIPKRGDYCGVAAERHVLCSQDLLFQRDLNESWVRASLLKVEFDGNFPEGCVLPGLKDYDGPYWVYRDLCFGPEHWNRQRLLDSHQDVRFPVAFLPFMNSGEKGRFIQSNLTRRKNRIDIESLEIAKFIKSSSGSQVFRTSWAKKTGTIGGMTRFVASGVLTNSEKPLEHLTIPDVQFNTLIGECFHAL